MSNTIGEHGRALLIAAQVFESHSWSDFEGLLPDLEFLPTFGQEVGGETSGAGGISPTKCIMYPNEFSSCLMNALWLPECPPLTTIKVRHVVKKQRILPMKSLLLATTPHRLSPFLTAPLIAGNCGEVEGGPAEEVRPDEGGGPERSDSSIYCKRSSYHSISSRHFAPPASRSSPYCPPL